MIIMGYCEELSSVAFSFWDGLVLLMPSTSQNFLNFPHLFVPEKVCEHTCLIWLEGVSHPAEFKGV